MEDKILLFLNIRRSALPYNKVECQLCGKSSLENFWQYGRVSINHRASKLCDNCHAAITSK